MGREVVENMGMWRSSLTWMMGNEEGFYIKISTTGRFGILFLTFAFNCISNFLSGVFWF